ncbi:hypothetical protein [Flavobacterium phycosphaerae]|uniref:hypothetical protein n=1 Tax=Flavobacterium phycosphaerae TaxID=2697515 RepID=UPI0013896B1D|nr:hypothetical protein [Flavobacterium phycosphaerae]
MKLPKNRDDYKAFKNRETGKKNQAASSSPPKKYIEKTFKNFIKLNFKIIYEQKKSIFYDKSTNEIIEDNFIS